MHYLNGSDGRFALSYHDTIFETRSIKMFPVKQSVPSITLTMGLCHVIDPHDIILLLDLIKYDIVSPLKVNMIYV